MGFSSATRREIHIGGQDSNRAGAGLSAAALANTPFRPYSAAPLTSVDLSGYMNYADQVTPSALSRAAPQVAPNLEDAPPYHWLGADAEALPA